MIVAHRDSLQSPSTADLSGTAVLLEMARVLSGESLQHTVVLASTTGSAGAVGAMRLAHTLQQPVDAVIALGDLAGTSGPRPDGRAVVDGPAGRAADAAQDASPRRSARSRASRPAAPALGGQLARLALPMSSSEQAPFGGVGQPAVLLSVSGERPAGPERADQPQPDQPRSAGPCCNRSPRSTPARRCRAPSSYLVFSGKSIPAWAIRLLVLALILPVLRHDRRRPRARAPARPLADPLVRLGARRGGPVRGWSSR